MVERFDETDCKCGLPVPVEASPEGELVRYADAQVTIDAIKADALDVSNKQQATIADLQGQAKDYQACRDVLDSTVLELTQVQQRVAQLEALLDTHKTEYRAVLQSKAKEIDEIQADCVKLRDRVAQLEGENKALVDAHRDFKVHLSHCNFGEHATDQTTDVGAAGVDCAVTETAQGEKEEKSCAPARPHGKGEVMAKFRKKPVVIEAVQALQSECWKEHVPVTGTQHDPANGLIHGYCARCRREWPCEWAPESQAASLPAQRAKLAQGGAGKHACDLPGCVSCGNPPDAEGGTRA